MNRYRTGKHDKPRRIYSALLMLVALCLVTGQAAANRKTDVVYLKNGDRITGEFKELLQGELKFSTSEMGTIFIKWEGIARIESDKYIELEMRDGTRMFGQVPSELNEADDILSVKTLKTDDPLKVEMDDVIRAEQIRVNDSWPDRLDGFISLGLNYTQASDVLTWNLGGEVKYRTRLHLNMLNFESTLTRKGDGQDTSRHNLAGSRYWYKEGRWFLFGGLGAQQNEELGLDLRVSVTGGAGKFLVQSPKTEFYLAPGLSANKEVETGTDGTNSDLSDAGTNIEALLKADYTFYRLYSPKSRIKAAATLWQGVTDTDRLRGNTNVTLRQEFVTDLFWDLSFYYDYDSKPLQGALAKEDFGIVTSLGYEF
jgi:hypothetical protein